MVIIEKNKQNKKESNEINSRWKKGNGHRYSELSKKTNHAETGNRNASK